MNTEKLNDLLQFCNEEICKQKTREFEAYVTSTITNTVNSHSLLRKVATKTDSVTVKTVPGQTVYLIPSSTSVPRTFVEYNEDTIFIPTFQAATSIEWLIKYAENGRIDIVQRAISGASRDLIALEEDALFRLLAPAATSDIARVGDQDPIPAPICQVKDGLGSGFMSRELVYQMFIRMQELGQTMTHVLVSPEDTADMREWKESQEGEPTRRELFISGSNRPHKIEHEGATYEIQFITANQLGMTGEYNINSHYSEGANMRVGTTGKFNKYAPEHPNLVGESGNLIKAGETQVYGLDLNDSGVVMPIVHSLRLFPDTKLLSGGKHGYHGWEEIGAAIVNPKSICMGVVDRYLPG